MSLKKSRSPSWLTILQNAKAVFIGEALVIEDVEIPATETSFRGAGYGITAQINFQQLLIGSSPTETIDVQGQTRRSSDTRLSLNSAYFPPDTLHRIDYWDYAKSNVPQLVLVILSEPTVIRVLDSLEDDLPQAVTIIYSWLQLPAEEQKAIVLEDLSQSVHNPIAYIAGFELLMSNESDVSVLFENLNNLPSRPGAAIQGIVDQLYRIALNLSEPELKALSWTLLDSWKTENDPAALSSYLLWFDAYRQRIWKDEPNMREAALAEAQRARVISFSGVNAEQWEQRVRYYASVLVQNSNS